MSTIFKNMVNGVLGRLGYELRRKRIGFDPRYLSQIFQPRTVIDVVVGHGTFPLYKAYPGAHFILIEPIREYAQSVERIARNYDCEIHWKAVGDRECSREMNIVTDDLQCSSFGARSTPASMVSSIEKRTVVVTTLDRIYS